MSNSNASRQADLRRRRKEAGLVEVTLWTIPDGRKYVREVAEMQISVFLNEPLEVTDAQIRGYDADLRASFLDGAGYMPVFQSPDGASRMGVRLIPYRGIPVLACMPLTHPCDRDQLLSRFGPLREAHKLEGYDWDDPRFRGLCKELGLDPNDERPEFFPEFELMGERVLTYVCRNWAALERRSDDDTVNPAERLLDVVTLARQDVTASPALTANLEDRLGRVREIAQRVKDPEYESIVFDAIDAVPELIRRFRTNTMRRGVINFLPSPFGSGFKATIAGDYGDHRLEDGWVPDYDHLSGIALLPSDAEYEATPWLRIIVKQLRARAKVLFLDPDWAAIYRDGEAVYWAWKWGHNGGHEVRPPTLTERALWRMRTPAMPISEAVIKADREKRRQRDAMRPVNGSMHDGASPDV